MLEDSKAFQLSIRDSFLSAAEFAHRCNAMYGPPRFSNSRLASGSRPLCDIHCWKQRGIVSATGRTTRYPDCHARSE